MLMPKIEIQKYTGYYISGHQFNYFSTRGEETIYSPSQESNPAYLTCSSPCVMKNLDVELPNGTWVDSFSCPGLFVKRPMSELLVWDFEFKTSNYRIFKDCVCLQSYEQGEKENQPDL